MYQDDPAVIFGIKSETPQDSGASVSFVKKVMRSNLFKGAVAEAVGGRSFTVGVTREEKFPIRESR
jgi:hypothetical protein